MADIVDASSTDVENIKADKNNNSTAHLDDATISPSDRLQTSTNDKSENTGDNDEHRLSSHSDSNQVNPNLSSASINTESSPNPYKDFAGIDTESFITNTLRNNPKDRLLLLTVEKIFQEFIEDKDQSSHQFQAMNSYERMIVHRVAACFGLDHNVDKNGQSIIVTKTANTRIPNFSFENFIPIDELPNGASLTTEPPTETPTRRIPHRNPKNPNPPSVNSTKPAFERPNHYVDTREKFPNKSNRKQRFNTNHHVQPTNFQPSTQFINTRAQLIYPSASNSFYPQSMDHDYKHQTNGSPMYNYVPMFSPTSYQQGMPVLLQQQPNGQIQYVFPSHTLQQPSSLSSDGQYMPIYRSDVMPPVVDNNLYPQAPYVHLYPTHSYPHTQQTTYIQPAPSFLMPSNNPTSIQYATNQLAALNLQSQYDDSRFSQSNNSQKSNGFNHLSNYQPAYRPNRPYNSNPADKQLSTIENDVKSTDQISLSDGSGQEKD